MSYTPKRADWWKERSALPDHQRAYDLIAGKVPRDAQAVIDLGCGTGEILKRLHQANPNRAIIGTDDSEVSIELLRENLRSTGIDFKFVEPAELKTPKRGVSILVDNLLKSNIPSNIADVALLTFPEAISEYETTRADYQELERFVRYLGHRIPDDKILDYLKAIKASGLASRILKTDGLYVFVRYDVAIPGSDRAIQVRRGYERQHAFSHLMLESMKFIESEEVHEDTDNYKQVEGERRGYRIFTFRKKNPLQG